MRLRKKEIAAGEFAGPTQDPRETTWSEVGAARNHLELLKALLRASLVLLIGLA
jgi:hypothetical protein